MPTSLPDSPILMRKRIFVAGATGLIGSHLVERLNADGNEVIALVRQGHAAENLARLRRLAVSSLHRRSTFKASLKRKRLRSALDHDYLLAILTT